MSGRRILLNLLEQEWTEDIPGREEPVPKPRIIDVGERKREDLAEGDLIYVKDGGDTEKNPNTIGWDHEEVVERVDIDIRTIDERGGRERLRGVLTDDYERERYGGLMGEVERILDSKRRGLGPFDTVELSTFDDLSEQQGFGRFRVEANVTLRRGPRPIDPSSEGEP